MPVNTLSLDGDWLLKDFDHEKGEAARPFDPASTTDDWLTTPVPGDIHPTLVDAGRLPADMFMGTNVEKCRWTGEREWWFRRDFDLPAGFARQRSELVFDGIDLFGTIWLNGRKVGETGNSHRAYRIDVTEALRPGQRNTLVVRVGATLKILEANPYQKYFACFNTPRVFARKAQCQFSWDWAPHLPALGIWRSVRLESFDSGRVMDVAVRPRNDGQVTFHMVLDERAYHQDLDQSRMKEEAAHSTKPTGDLVVEITGPVNVPKGVKNKPIRHRISVTGQKNFCTLTVPKPQLWWPNGYGQQPLYRYRITLVRNGKTHHQIEGRFAFREVKLVEEPIDADRLSFRFEVNGTPVFCKGANWVPPSCFPGTLKTDRYRHLVRLAHSANFNMIRVWGGGIYESDAFYDACDELGIMVWQDFMFACSDYPDDDPAFVEQVIPEIEYQVKRLRNRPCVVYWCGGNEKTGSAGFKVSYGERLFHVLIRGICSDLDPTRPYRPASPQSHTDLGNDRNSGDSHGGCYEQAYEAGITCWRDKLREFKTVFNSEFGYHGPTRMQSLIKFVPADEIWPLGEAMEYHVQDNPYNTIPETFAQVQARMASTLVGDISDAESFVRCASTFHAELIRAEIEHHRRRKWLNAGAMFWMFDDCWPCASWSVVDYYLLPKPAYYAGKRGFAPIIVAIIDEPDRYNVYVVNDTLKPLTGTLTLGQGRVVGKPVWSRKCRVKVEANSSLLATSIRKSEVRTAAGSYLFSTLAAGAKVLAETSFFRRPWREIDWPVPELSWKISKSLKAPADHPANSGSQYVTTVTLKTVHYARMVHIDGVEGIGTLLSDNFFDMLPGSTKTVEIRTNHRIDPAALRISHWLDRWEE
jgi:beta-mannosidase